MQSISKDLKQYSRLLMISLFILGCTLQKDQLQKIQGYALGTTYSISYTSNSLSPTLLNQKVDSIFQVINQSLSTYQSDSDISKINRGDSLLVVDSHFVTVYEKASEVWEHSQGFFDPTVGALVNAYGFGPGKSLEKVSKKQRDSMLEFTGWAKTQLTTQRTIQKEHPSVFFDFNALAKGYTVDVLANFLKSNQLDNYLVEIGGELVAKGKSPRTGNFWKIAIDNPKQGQERNFIRTLRLQNEALATSGNYRKYSVDAESGLRIAHSINPKTGEAFPTGVLSASVIAPDCMSADAYATALMVMPLAQSQKLIDSKPELQAYWIVSDSIQGIQELFSDVFLKEE